MFNKKPRRNFRQRKNESSEEEDNENGVSSPERHDSKPTSALNSDSPRERVSDCSNAHESESSDADESAAAAGLHKPSTSNTLSFSDDKESTGGSFFKVKRSVQREVVFQARKKEDSPVPIRSPQVNQVENLDAGSDSDAGSAEDLPPDSDDERSSSIISNSSSGSSKPHRVNIPGAREIHAAKQQRRRARAQRDYISLETHSNPGSVKEDNPSSEERESDSEPDDHERRIEFAPRTKSLRERMAEKIGSGSEQSYSDSQEDEDQQIWEEQQIGKGVKKQKHAPGGVKPVKQKKSTIPKTLPPVSIDVMKKRITGKLDPLRSVHRAREAELRKMQMDLEMARDSLENLENHPGDDQLLFYRTMNVFSQNLLECLSEKMALINAVELDMHSLYIDQAEALLNRRREALQEEAAIIQTLTFGTGSLGSEGTLEFKECLPDYSIEDCVPPDRQEVDEEEAELRNRRAVLQKQAEEIFADVQADFWDVKKILSRFDDWRISFPDSYTNAYISLCLPKLLAPLIRHQLIVWNPLKPQGEDFEALPWYSAVERFCHGQGYEESENIDKTTLPAIIEKTILCKVRGFVELVWDPLSTLQSQSLTALCHRLQDDYSTFEGEQSKPVMAFTEAVIQKLRSAVDNDVFVPLYPKTVLENKYSPHYQFQHRQFWSAVKLLGNMALWDGLIPESVLKELILEKVLGRYLMITILNDPDPKDTVQKCRLIADFFPKSWFVNVESGSSLSQLQNFSKHLLQTAHVIFKSDTQLTSTILSDILCVLKNIKADDHVKKITEKYHCEELLKSLM